MAIDHTDAGSKMGLYKRPSLIFSIIIDASFAEFCGPAEFCRFGSPYSETNGISTALGSMSLMADIWREYITSDVETAALESWSMCVKRQWGSEDRGEATSPAAGSPENQKKAVPPRRGPPGNFHRGGFHRRFPPTVGKRRFLPRRVSSPRRRRRAP